MNKISFLKEKFKWRRNYALLILSLLAATTVYKAQLVSGYTFAESNGTYTPITGGTNMVLLPTETSGFNNQFFHNGLGGINGTTTAGTYSAFPLGFNFKYRGNSYNGFYIGTDGWIMLGSTSGSSIAGASSSPLSSTTNNTNDVISVFGADLSGSLRSTNVTRVTGSPILTITGNSTGMAGNITVGMRVVGSGIPAGATIIAVSGTTITMSADAISSSTASSVFFVEPDNISYSLSGAAGSQVLTVQWKNVQRWTGSGDVLNFQIKLYEATNVVQMVYNNTATTQITNATTVQVGLKGTVVQSDYNNRTGTGGTAWSTSVAGTASNASLPFQGAAAPDGEIVPASGLTYSWTPPPVCSGLPVAGTVSPSSQNLVAGQPTASLLISGFSSGVVGLTFQWQESSDNINWTNVTAGTGANTAYYTPPVFAGSVIYYRCAVTCSGSAQTTNSNSVVVSPCAQSVAFAENFDTITTPALPTCWTKVGTTGSANTQAGTIGTAPNVLYINSSSGTAIAMVSMPPLSTLQSGVYRLRFKARSSSSIGGVVQVGYLTNPSDQSTFTSLGSFTTTSTTVADNFVLNNITAPAGVTTLAFRHTGTPANAVLIDDVAYELIPTCFEPTAVTIAGITPSAATVSWTAPTTTPANGYEVYYSTSNVAPTSATVLNTTNSKTSSTTSATISGLIPNNIYYVWVRSVCVGADRSVWTSVAVSFITPCQPPALLSVTGASFCPGTAAILTATADAGATINWYDGPTSGNLVGTGSPFTTPSLTSTTNYFVSASTGTSESVGVANPGVLTNHGITPAGNINYMEATVINTPVTVQSVDVFPNAAGYQSFIRVYLGTSTTPVYEISFTSDFASGGVTPQTVPLNIILNPGIYRFKIEGAGSYYRNYSTPGGVGQNFPYGQGNFTLTGGSNVTLGYFLFYNFMVGNGCHSVRQAVIATADPAQCLGTSEVGGNKNDIQLYPNPFTDVVNISDSKNVKTVSIVDISGRMIKTIEKPGSALHLAELKSGMYVVVITMNDGSLRTVKVIKK